MTFLSQCQKISFPYIYYIWNRVDRKRIKEVGAHVACAEWLLRNSAYVRFKGRPKLVTGYYNIPTDRSSKLSEVHAVNSGITVDGFPYLQGLDSVEKIFLINSKMIDNHCLDSLRFVSETLQHLELERCPDVTIKGIQLLTRLKSLKYLRLHLLEGVTEEEWQILQDNCKQLFPNCETKFEPSDFIEAEHTLPPSS